MTIPHTRYLTCQMGFTLPEVIISATIISILMAIAVPSFEHVIEKQRAQSTIQTLVNQLELARHTAISSNRKVALCSANLREEHCIHNTDWSGSLMVFIDNNQNNLFDDSDVLLNSITRLTSSGQLNTTSGGILSFDQFGNIAGISRSFHYCTSGNSVNLARGLSVNAQGRYRIWQDTNNNGIVDSNGEDISC